MTEPAIERLPQAVQAYIECMNEGDFGKIRQAFAEDAEIWGVLGHGTLLDAEPVWRELHTGMAMHLEVIDAAIDGSRVVVRYLETGCFKGPFRGLPGIEPTNREYKITAIEWFELRDGLISKRWGAQDPAAITRQVCAPA